MKTLLKTAFIFFYFLFYLALNIYSQNSNETATYNNYLNNQFLRNSFFVDPGGKCYFSNCNDSIYSFNSKLINKWDLIFEETLSLSFDLHKSQIMYRINSENEVLKTVTNGESWIKIQNGLPPTETFNDIKVNPHNSSEVFLFSQNNIYKTTDAGFTWNHLCKSRFTYGFSISQNQPTKIYLLDSDSLYLSDDGGHSWKNISKKIISTNQLNTLKPTKDEHLTLYSFANFVKKDTTFVFAFTNHGIYYTTDEGVIWNEANKNMDINSMLFIVYFDGTTIYAGGKNTKDQRPILYKSDISPVSWIKVDLLADESDYITGIYKENNNESIYVSTYMKKIYQIDSTKQIVGLNYGMLPHSIIHSKASSANNNSRVTVALLENNKLLDIKNYGVWKSTDNGRTWKDICLYNKRDNAYGLTELMISPHNSNEILLFDKGLNLISLDGGVNWGGIQNNGIKLEDNTILDFRYDPFDKNIVYIITYWGGEESILLRYDRTTLGFTELRKITDDIADDRDVNFIISSNDNKKIFISNGDISLDGGWTWESVFENMDKITEDLNINNAIVKVTAYTGDRIEVELYEKGYNYILNCNRIVSEDNGKNWFLKEKWETKVIKP